MDAFQQHWGLYFLREICLIFVINCKMIFCSSSSLMPVDECTLHKCTSGWKAGFFSLLSRCSGVVSSFCWSCLFVLLVCWARLGWVPGVERIWIDLCQRREGGDNLHALPEVWPSPLCPSNCRNFNAPLNEVLIMIVIKRDGQFASSVRPGQEIWAGQRWEIQARDTHEDILLNIEG